MTAFYSVQYPDRIEILSDGAFYRPDGTVIGFRTKVRAADSKAIAFVRHGCGATTDMLMIILLALAEREKTVDSALLAISEFVAARAETVRAEPDPIAVAGAAGILIAAFSEEAGPVTFYFCTVPLWGMEPWTLYETSCDFGVGMPDGVDDAEALRAAGIDVDAMREGLRSQGPALFNLMRGSASLNPVTPDLPPIHGVGGHLDLTILRTEGVTIERIHEWPDVIGERITP